jgi:hypothetical protein
MQLARTRQEIRGMRALLGCRDGDFHDRSYENVSRCDRFSRHYIMACEGRKPPDDSTLNERLADVFALFTSHHGREPTAQLVFPVAVRRLVPFVRAGRFRLVREDGVCRFEERSGP